MTEPLSLIQFNNFLHLFRQTSFIIWVKRCFLSCAKEVRPSCFKFLWIVMMLTAFLLAIVESDMVEFGLTLLQRPARKRGIKVTSCLVTGPLVLARLIKMPPHIRKSLPGIRWRFCNTVRAVACAAKLDIAECLFCPTALYVAYTRPYDEVASLLDNQLQLGHISVASFHRVKVANHLANL